jgi:hypothetical protein
VEIRTGYVAMGIYIIIFTEFGFGDLKSGIKKSFISFCGSCRNSCCCCAKKYEYEKTILLARFM